MIYEYCYIEKHNDCKNGLRLESIIRRKNVMKYFSKPHAENY